MTASASQSTQRNNPPPSFCVNDYLQHWQEHTEKQLQHGLAEIDRNLSGDKNSQTLSQAMAYSLLDGGKRIRPILAFAASQALGMDQSVLLDRIACALEMLHTYSLIHDDLPAMDDDDLRRGRPSCHIAFGEANAILAGDALLTLALEQLTDPILLDTNISAVTLIQCQRELTQASGALGMVRGQAIDLNAVNSQLTQQQLESMHQHKTGALIVASIRMGAIAAGATQIQLEQLTTFAQGIGLAFQVQDDCLDVTATTEVLGKQQGSDADQGKPTFVTLLGLKAAKDYAESLYRDSLGAINQWDSRATALRSLAKYIVHRQH